MRLLSSQEVAKLLRISPCTVRMNAAKGRLGFRTVKVGALWKFPDEDVYKYLYGTNWKEKTQDLAMGIEDENTGSN